MPPPLPNINVNLGEVLIEVGETTPQDFGSVVESGTNPSLTFTVVNAGVASILTIYEVVLPAGYVFGVGNEVPATGTTIDVPWDSKALIVELDSTLGVGIKTGDVVILNDVEFKSPYNFAITGEVLSGAPPVTEYSIATSRISYVSLAGATEVTVMIDRRYRYKMIHTGMDDDGNDDANSAKSAWLSTLSETIAADKSVEDEKFELMDGTSETIGPGIMTLYLKSTTSADAVVKLVRIGLPSNSY